MTLSTETSPGRRLLGRSFSDSAIRHIIAIAVATLVIFFWIMFLRSSADISGIELRTPDIEIVDPYLWGITVQEMVVPITLLFLLSRTALFRRIITAPTVSKIPMRDLAWLVSVLALIQVLVIASERWQIVTLGSQVTLGLFITFVAGLIGGWRAGLGVGIIAMLGIGWLDYQHWNEPFQFSVYIEYFILKHLSGLSAVWMGFTVGSSSELLGQRRFRPLVALTMSLVAEFLVFVFLIVSTDSPDYLFDTLLPDLVITSLAVIAFVVMVRTVQDDESRHTAELARLELAQTNLELANTSLALTKAELRALHAQINPHFFFNSLNTIRYFIRTDPNNARDLLIKLSEIFQRALSAGETVPLEDEISHVEAYLALEKARLEDNLQIVWTDMAKNLHYVPVPTLILQPMVENAVIHGIATQPEGGTLHILINRVGNDLLFQVADDGPGFDTSQLDGYLRGDVEVIGGNGRHLPTRSGPSIGLRNVHERLQMLYGAEYGLNIESEPGEGTRVVFRVPVGVME